MSWLRKKRSLKKWLSDKEVGSRHLQVMLGGQDVEKTPRIRFGQPSYMESV